MGALYVDQWFHYHCDSFRGGDGFPYAICFSLAWPDRILLFYTPPSPTASPRHAIYGHAIGILCGCASLLPSLHHAPSTIGTTVDSRRIMAAALSLALTASLMILLKAAHPPAGATTLIVSLGVVTKPFYLLIIEIAVALLVGQGIVINRLAGLDYPLWAKRLESTQASQPTPSGRGCSEKAQAGPSNCGSRQ
ncbi:MAG: HPP family protein [Terriglobia bacterium]